MAFRFPLESILKFRKRVEELAQREYMESKTRLEACLHGIERMYLSIDEARQSVSLAQRSGNGNDLKMIGHIELFIDGQKIRIHKERLRAREMIVDVEQKEEILLQRLHDRKIMEKLKDRRHEEYQERINRLEQKELDDLTNSRTAGSQR